MNSLETLAIGTALLQNPYTLRYNAAVSDLGHMLGYHWTLYENRISFRQLWRVI